MAHAPRLTPQQLIERMAQTGRVVTSRTLTDWRNKGLLPRLQARGIGQGKGQLQYWDSPEIIGQAIIVWDTMALKRRSDFTTWVLWFCGYDVDAETVRRYWLKLLKGQNSSQRIEPGEFLSDKYTAEIDSLARGLSANHKLDLDITSPIAREIIVATNEPPDAPINTDELEELTDAARVLANRFDWIAKAGIKISDGLLLHLLHIFRSYVSSVGLQQTLKSISTEELYRAQGYLKTAASLLHAMAFASQQNQIDEIQLLEIRKAFAPIFGRLLFELILLIIKSGQETVLRLATPIIAQMEAGFRAGAKHPKKPPNLTGKLEELVSVFSALDWSKVYNSA